MANSRQGDSNAERHRSLPLKRAETAGMTHAERGPATTVTRDYGPVRPRFVRTQVQPNAPSVLWAVDFSKVRTVRAGSCRIRHQRPREADRRLAQGLVVRDAVSQQARHRRVLARKSNSPWRLTMRDVPRLQISKNRRLVRHGPASNACLSMSGSFDSRRA
jgi:hypothetical protein